MVIKGIDEVDLTKIYPGDTVKLKISDKTIVSEMVQLASEMGCKLILLNYGEYYFKEFFSKEREKIINSILKN